MKTIILLFLVFFIPKSIFAVDEFFRGDTVRYKFERVLVELANSDGLKNALDTQIISEVKQIQQILGGLTIVPPNKNETITISFREMGDKLQPLNFKEIGLNRTNRNTKQLVVFNDGTTFDKSYGNYCLFLNSKTKELKIYVEDLSDLDFFYTNEFQLKTEQASVFLKNKFGENYKKGILAWLDLRTDSVKGFFQDVSYQTNDMIILQGGVGSGFIKNQIVSSFDFRLGFAFGYKGMLRNTYFIDYELFYDFPKNQESLNSEINGFLSLGLEHNFSMNPGKDNWYGFSIGYLVNRANNFFGENAVKVSVHKRINNSITLLPEIYFNDFYKKGSPALRVQISF